MGIADVRRVIIKIDHQSDKLNQSSKTCVDEHNVMISSGFNDIM